MRWLGGLILLLVLGVSPAAAHKLRVFAVAEGAVISGHGFLVGGGRANGVVVMLLRAGAADPEAVITADADGKFRFEVARAGPYVVRIDAGDGHMAEARVTISDGAGAQAPTATSTPPAATTALSSVACPDETALRALIATAVAQELRPLAERIEAADARLRFTDIAGGLGMILGLAGLALWARAKRLIGPPS